MTEESNKKKRAVESEIMDTTSLQVELDKTASNFRRSQRPATRVTPTLGRHHRADVSRTPIPLGLKNVRSVLFRHHRDRDIDLLAAVRLSISLSSDFELASIVSFVFQQLVKIKAEARSVEEQIIEKREFYDNEQRNNNERQLQMSMAERQAARMRTQYDDAEKNRMLYENEVNRRWTSLAVRTWAMFLLQLSGLRRVVKRTEKDKEMAYALLNQIKKQIADRRQYLEEVAARKRELIEKKREILDTKYTAEEKANKMDKLYSDEQEREMALNSELKSTSERMYKITQEIFDLKAREKNLEADINGSAVTMNNLQAKTNKLDHEALKQQEVLYHQDFEIQSLERRINRMQGEKSTEEQAMLERKISELQEELDRKREDHAMLKTQTKQIEEEKRRLQKSLGEISREKTTEQGKIEELELHADNAQRLIRKLNDDKEVKSFLCSIVCSHRFIISRIC